MFRFFLFPASVYETSHGDEYLSNRTSIIKSVSYALLHSVAPHFVLDHQDFTKLSFQFYCRSARSSPIRTPTTPWFQTLQGFTKQTKRNTRKLPGNGPKNMLRDRPHSSFILVGVSFIPGHVVWYFWKWLAELKCYYRNLHSFLITPDIWFSYYVAFENEREKWSFFRQRRKSSDISLYSNWNNENSHFLPTSPVNTSL